MHEQNNSWQSRGEFSAHPALSTTAAAGWDLRGEKCYGERTKKKQNGRFNHFWTPKTHLSAGIQFQFSICRLELRKQEDQIACQAS